MAEVTGFYKDLYDLVVVTNNFVQRDGQAVPERKSNDGIGRVYGGELLLRQAVSKWFFGWISYTLMRSERKDCATCEWRLFDFDQTHVLVIAVHAYLPRGFEVGARFRYITGFPYTLAVWRLLRRRRRRLFAGAGPGQHRATAGVSSARSAHRQDVPVSALGAQALPRHHQYL